MTRVFVLSGHVQGTCSHRHTTLIGAARCAYKHARLCDEEGRYSDRRLKILEAGGVDEATFEENRQFQLALETERNSHLTMKSLKRSSSFVDVADFTR